MATEKNPLKKADDIRFGSSCLANYLNHVCFILHKSVFHDALAIKTGMIHESLQTVLVESYTMSMHSCSKGDLMKSSTRRKRCITMTIFIFFLLPIASISLFFPKLSPEQAKTYLSNASVLIFQNASGIMVLA